MTYGTKTSAAAAGSGTAALSGRSISVGLDTGDSKNFKLCYKEIPVTVTVPANTTYTVALKFELKGTYTRSNRKATAKASFQVVYLGGCFRRREDDGILSVQNKRKYDKNDNWRQ